jgi:phosphonate metabolism-associated iron-containing alcohol dehydrogenase
MPSKRFWHMPVAVTFGSGSFERLAADLELREVVVVAFGAAGDVGVESDLRQQLGARVAGWVPVPDGLASVERARQVAAAVWPRLDAAPQRIVLGVGGGSTLDIAKLVRCRPLDNDFDALCAALRGQREWPPMAQAPLWLVPTTAGTGSEVTPFATIWDVAGERALKRSLDEPFAFADRAVVDPRLTLTCPHAVLRDAALDALSHALEALWNRNANPMSDALAVAAARELMAALPLALAAPGDLGHRERLSHAALQAGLAFSQTRTALAHALSYALTLEQGLSHGLACSLWLPTAWRLAAGRDPRIDRHLASIVGVPAEQGAARLGDWLRSVGAETEPEAIGITDGARRVEAALGSQRGRNFIGSTALDPTAATLIA